MELFHSRVGVGTCRIGHPGSLIDGPHLAPRALIGLMLDFTTPCRVDVVSSRAKLVFIVRLTFVHVRKRVFFLLSLIFKVLPHQVFFSPLIAQLTV